MPGGLTGDKANKNTSALAWRIISHMFAVAFKLNLLLAVDWQPGFLLVST